MYSAASSSLRSLSSSKASIFASFAAIVSWICCFCISSFVAKASSANPVDNIIFCNSSSLKSFVTSNKAFLAWYSASIFFIFSSVTFLIVAEFSSAAVSVNPSASVKAWNAFTINKIGMKVILRTVSSIPIFFKNIPIATTIKVIAATNKNIGLASI